MNVTFLIGNGFDLNLGLKTAYKDFYDYYIKHTKPNMLSKAISSNYEIWADLEIGIGNFLKEIGTNDVDYFLQCKGDLERLLSEYLLAEQRKLLFAKDDIVFKEFEQRISNFSYDFNNRDSNYWTSVISNLPESINYNFIVFNYTNTIDRIIDACLGKPFSQHKYPNNTNPIKDAITPPLHIHGNANSGMILGINDINQINNEELRNNRDLSNYIIKENINSALGNMNTERARKLIDISQFICIYGMSIGDTDSMWWSYLIKWLLSNNKNRLLLYVYSNTIVQASGQEYVRNSDMIRNKIANHYKKLSENELTDLRNRISIIYNSSIFDFESIKVTEEQNGQTEDGE